MLINMLAYYQFLVHQFLAAHLQSFFHCSETNKDNKCCTNNQTTCAFSPYIEAV